MDDTDVTIERSGTVPRLEQRSRIVRAGACAGLIGPALFVAAWLIQAAARSEEFDLIGEPASALAAGDAGWIQTVSFIVYGLMTLVFAAGLHRAMAPSRLGWIGPSLIGVTGVGLLWGAAFPLRREASGELVDPGLHAVGGFMYFVVGTLAIIAIIPRMRADARWRGLVPYSIVVAALLVAAHVVMAICALPEDGPLRPYPGLTQLVFVVLLRVPWQLTMAVRMLRVPVAPELRSRASAASRG
ncbi:DUF998 domain-containing protein [Agromyces sp. SYSU T00194]|uniref:DUF998 domain-containing protein n=1 Tax=Agromyces chitinivorans TaxID=3158560 RepID=UPI0033923A6A